MITEPAALRAILLDELTRIAPDIDPGNFDDNADLKEDYDLDSMDSFNLAAAIHRRLQINIPEAEFSRLKTLNDVARYLQAQEKIGALYK